MARNLRIAAIAGVAVMVAIITALGGMYYSMQQVQPFYEQAIQLDPQVLREGSRELESRATALYSDAQQSGQWQAAFTAEQINGWLMLRFSEDAADRTADISEPRVALHDDTLSLGFRTRRSGVETVVSVDASVFLTEAGEVAVHLLSMRAGALPLPVMQVADEIARACQELSLPVRWTQSNGQPVAIINIQRSELAKGHLVAIDTIELRDGSLFVAGHTEANPPEAQVVPELSE